jgi:hypothetical protein
MTDLKAENAQLKRALAEQIRKSQLDRREALAKAMDEGQGITIPDDGVYVKKGAKLVPYTGPTFMGQPVAKGGGTVDRWNVGEGRKA